MSRLRERFWGFVQESEPLIDEWGFSNREFFSRLIGMSESEWTKVLGWPGYRVYRSEINEEGKTRRRRGNRKLERTEFA